MVNAQSLQQKRLKREIISVSVDDDYESQQSRSAVFDLSTGDLTQNLLSTRIMQKAL
jgi:hypothetical protein